MFLQRFERAWKLSMKERTRNTAGKCALIVELYVTAFELCKHFCSSKHSWKHLSLGSSEQSWKHPSSGLFGKSWNTWLLWGLIIIITIWVVARAVLYGHCLSTPVSYCAVTCGGCVVWLCCFASRKANIDKLWDQTIESRKYSHNWHDRFPAGCAVAACTGAGGESTSTRTISNTSHSKLMLGQSHKHVFGEQSICL